MSERRPSSAFPDGEQAVAFHRALMERLGLDPSGAVNEAGLRASLERAQQMGQGQRADVVSLAAFLLFGLIRDKPFETANTQTGLALTLAFLIRNGVAVEAPDEELAGVSIGVAQGEVYAGMVEMWLRDSARPFYR